MIASPLHRWLRSGALFAALLSFAGSLHAQELTAQVSLQEGKSETMALLGGGPGGQLKLRPPGQQQFGSISVAPQQVLQMHVNFPDSVFAGFEAMDKGDWNTAARLLGPSATAAAPYLSVSGNNIAPVVMSYGDALRYLGAYDQAIALFEILRSSGSQDVSRLGGAWKAYLLTRKNDIAGARALVDGLGDPKRDDDLFGIVRLVRAYIFLHTAQYRAAADQIAQVVAFSGLESSIYPEALYVDGLCYEAIALEARGKAEQAREDAIKRATFAERVRIGREMWTLAQQQGEQPPAEEQIMAKVDVAGIKSKMPPVPPLEEFELYQVGHRVYTQLIRTYPRTPWSALAQKRVKTPSPPAKEKPKPTIK